MAGDTYGRLFTVTTFGESHGPAMGCVVDGCPPGLALTEADLQKDLDRRRPGRSRHVTQRQEPDQVKILSGVFEGRTTGTAIGLLVDNVDQKSGDYSKIKDSFRPGHADYTYQQKYGIRDYRGGGRASARETVMRVAAGAIARKYLEEQLGLKIRGYLAEIGPFKLRALDLEHVDDNAFFCADPDKLPQLEVFLDELRRAGDSIGARINLIASGVPVGLGEPVFDKLEGEIAKGLMSINAVKGVEFGDGFECVRQRGSEHRDELTPDGFKKNSSGGTLGRYLERSGHPRQHRSETDVEHPSAGRDRRQGRARHRDRDDGSARPLRGLASDADRRGDARAHTDGPLLASSRSERRRALQRAGADGSAKPLE